MSIFRGIPESALRGTGGIASFSPPPIDLSNIDLSNVQLPQLVAETPMTMQGNIQPMAAPVSAPRATQADTVAPVSTDMQMRPEDAPFATGVRQVASGLDPLTEQLLFGIGGEGGFIPGAMRAAEKVFFDAEGKPVVIEEQVAGFTPDQLRAQELARQGIGIQDRFIGGAEEALGAGIGALGLSLIHI